VSKKLSLVGRKVLKDKTLNYYSEV